MKASSASFRAAGFVPMRPLCRPGQSGKIDLKLLHVLSSVDPNGGGPMEGVRQRGMRLQQLGHSVEVVTLDDPGREYLKEFPLTVHALGPSRGSYGYNAKTVPALIAHASTLDADTA